MNKTRFKNWSKGLNKDTPRHLINADECAELENAVYRSGIWTKRDGYTEPNSATADGFSVIEVADYLSKAQVSTLLCGTKDSLYYLNGTTWVNRLNLGSTRTDTDKWFFAEGNGQ